MNTSTSSRCRIGKAVHWQCVGSASAVHLPPPDCPPAAASTGQRQRQRAPCSGCPGSQRATTAAGWSCKICERCYAATLLVHIPLLKLPAPLCCRCHCGGDRAGCGGLQEPGAPLIAACGCLRFRSPAWPSWPSSGATIWRSKAARQGISTAPAAPGGPPPGRRPPPQLPGQGPSRRSLPPCLLGRCSTG